MRNVGRSSDYVKEIVQIFNEYTEEYEKVRCKNVEIYERKEPQTSCSSAVWLGVVAGIVGLMRASREQSALPSPLSIL